LTEYSFDCISENHDHVTELQRLRTHNIALLEENQQLKEKTLVLLENVRSSTEENQRLVNENVALTRSPATRLLRKPVGTGLTPSGSSAQLSARPKTPGRGPAASPY
jgi:hypothetical protein